MKPTQPDRSPHVCPKCRAVTLVSETRVSGLHLRRIRKCSDASCSYRFSTREVRVARGSIGQPMVIDLGRLRLFRRKLAAALAGLSGVLGLIDELLTADPDAEIFDPAEPPKVNPEV